MKLLILSAPGGSGHIQAAKALLAAAQQHQQIDVQYYAITDFFPPIVTNTLFAPYESIVHTVPSLWGAIYRITNTRIGRHAVHLLSYFVRRGFARHTRVWDTFLDQYNPDWILCTHFAARKMIPRDWKKNIGVIITDHVWHENWFGSHTDTYFVANEAITQSIQKHHNKSTSIVVSGIPVHSPFFVHKDIHILKKTYGCPSGQSIFLFLTGGNGLIDPTAYINILQQISTPITVIVICGNNTKLQQHLNAQFHNTHHTYHIVGWTDMIDEYMRIANVIVTKPGGITTSECMVLQKPMLLILPIPGQETENALFLSHINGVSYLQCPEDMLKYTFNAVCLSTKLPPQKKSPNASRVILDTILEISN